jgi:hypothetical protein
VCQLDNTDSMGDQLPIKRIRTFAYTTVPLSCGFVCIFCMRGRKYSKQIYWITGISTVAHWSLAQFVCKGIYVDPLPTQLTHNNSDLSAKAKRNSSVTMSSQDTHCARPVSVPYSVFTNPFSHISLLLTQHLVVPRYCLCQESSRSSC